MVTTGLFTMDWIGGFVKPADNQANVQVVDWDYQEWADRFSPSHFLFSDSSIKSIA